MRFEKVRRYFVDGLWSGAMVRNAVVKGWITAAEYAQIVGEEF